MINRVLIFVIKALWMLHPIIEEVWTADAQPRPLRRPRIKDAREGREAAYQRARELATGFDEYGETYSYAWGRNKNAAETYRFIVR
jgi:hypothetical protein